MRGARGDWRMDHAYLGPSYSDDAIEAFLKEAQLPYRRLDNVAAQTAALLAADRVIGWFQGPHGVRSACARRTFDPRVADRSGHAAQAEPDQGSRGLPAGRAGRAREQVASLVHGRPAPAAARAVHAVRVRRRAGRRRDHPRGAPHRRHRARADRRRKPASAAACAADGVRCADRRAGARQHVVQYARRADRLHAARRDRVLLDVAARRARDRFVPAGEAAMNMRDTQLPPTVSVVVPTFRRPDTARTLSRRTVRAGARSDDVRDRRRRRRSGRQRAAGGGRVPRARERRAGDPLHDRARYAGAGRRAQRRLAQRARRADRVHRRRYDSRPDVAQARRGRAARRAVGGGPRPGASTCRCARARPTTSATRPVSRTRSSRPRTASCGARRSSGSAASTNASRARGAKGRGP
ncbi:hypothetical protein BDAG_04932 [Burkholderia dolosa AU0158]|nr:hypothetical protein BDAG_04932 [Burkholderia dolosa AU0158]